MKDRDQYNQENKRLPIAPLILIPLSLFPLASLVSYDWRAVAALNAPPIPSLNWVGALGDSFAYHGYLLLGLAVWVVPAVFILGGVCIILGRSVKSWRRIFWFTAFTISASALIQVVGSHSHLIASIDHRLNLADPGGAIGYLIMTRGLSPLISDFSSSLVMALMMIISFIAAIGMHNLAGFFAAIFTWAAGSGSCNDATGPAVNTDFEQPSLDLGPAESTDSDSPAKKSFNPFGALSAARAEAKRIREEEKAAAREEKARIKAEKLAEKQRLKAAALAAKSQSPAPTPVPSTSVSPSTSTTTPPSTSPDKGPYLLPSLSLLNPLSNSKADHSDVGEMSQRIINTLNLFGVSASMSYTVQGPVVTKYALKLAEGVRYEKVRGLYDNLQGALQAKSLRIEAPIPGENCVGIEVPNRAPVSISFREIIESDTWKNFKGELPLLFGKDASGKNLVADLASMPHMLVAGATGQGKSVCLNSIICGLLMTRTPEQLKLIMVDPKSVEFTSYTSIPHLIVPIITENNKVVFSLKWAVNEMEKRLKLFARAKVRNIFDFNHRLQFTQTDMFGNDTQLGGDIPKSVPYIVIIIDEVADLMQAAGKEVTPYISRLTAKARAAGIHLILATQRPDAKIITGTIKANIPGRVAFKTSTAIDSRTILDDSGAESLIGKGDMLFKSKDGLLIRAQGAWISDPEIARITNFIEQHSDTQFDDRFTQKLSTIKEEEVDLYGDNQPSSDDAKQDAAAQREKVKAEENATDFKKAVECVINTNRASISHFQRQLGWGYNHSAKIVDMLEAAGIIGPQAGAGPRQVIMDQDQLLAIFNGDSSDPATATADDSATTPSASDPSRFSPTEQDLPL